MAGDAAAMRLDHLHAIIQRLANNSFTIKGWAVTVASGFLGFSVKDARPAIAFVGLVPILIFWLMDSWYLTSERHFRHCYNDVLKDPAVGGAPVAGHVTSTSEWGAAMRTPVLAALYAGLAICCVVLGIGLFAVQS